MKALEKVSQVIELKKDRYYVFVFDSSSGVTSQDAYKVLDVLAKKEYKGCGIIVKDIKGLTVFEKEI